MRETAAVSVDYGACSRGYCIHEAVVERKFIDVPIQNSEKSEKTERKMEEMLSNGICIGKHSSD